MTTNRIIDETAKDYLKYKKMEDDAHGKRVAARDKLFKYFIERGVKKLTGDWGHLSYVKEQDSLVFDSERFAKDYPELYAQYCTKTKTGREYLR